MKKLFSIFASALLICALMAGPAAAAMDGLKDIVNKTANKIDQKVDKKQVKEDTTKAGKDVKKKTVDKE